MAPRNCANGALGLQPIDELAGLNYLGKAGGLWLQGSNAAPQWHDEFALKEAKRIQPRSNGKIGFAALGFSFGRAVTQQLEAVALAEVLHLNPDVVSLNLAKPGVDADDLADPMHLYWTSWLGTELATLGYSADDVQVAWCETGRQLQTQAWPAHADSLAIAVEKFALNAKAYFPNLRLLYMTGPHPMHYFVGAAAEPYFYEQQWGIRDALRKQARGDLALNSMPERGPAVAPTLLWAGRGFWCDGPRARPDGHSWLCPQDVSSDGAHTSPAGALKLARLLLADLAKSATGREWLLRLPAPGGVPGGTPPTISTD